jgi:hypothetical protein
MRSLAQDLAFALRLHRKQPGTVLAAVAGLALAIGLTTAVVSVVNATMYRRLTLPDAPLLRWVRSTETTPVASRTSLIRQFTYRAFTQLAAQTDESRLAAVVSATARLEGHDDGLASGVSTWFVSGGFFEIVVLGAVGRVRPGLAGRRGYRVRRQCPAPRAAGRSRG